jgi:hypothetical protein
LKRSLVVAGFWDEEETSNPTSENAAAGLLLQRIERRLVPGAYLYFPQAPGEAAVKEVRVMWSHMTSVLARDEDLHVAICQAALELPGFLKRHPECAAPAVNDEVEREQMPDLPVLSTTGSISP